jgi:hypothetical protein
MNNSMMSTYKSDGKNVNSFDDAIKRMADEIVKMVNIPKKEEVKKKK